MKYQLVSLPDSINATTAEFLEGAVFAANLTTKPLDPDTWLAPLMGDDFDAVKSQVVEQIHMQHNRILRNEYSLLEIVKDNEEGLADFAEGFMSVWPTIEEQWVELEINDGLQRMLQAWLTTMMLAIDEVQTQQQMIDAGFEAPPSLGDFVDQLDIMINEVAQGADALMVGNKAQSVNPFKDIGRNDNCLCGSGKKFKQCCGQ